MQDAVAALARILERAGVPYALIGGHAVNVWLEPRFTADVDVTVQATPADVARLTALLAAEGYAVARAHGAELPSGPDFVRFVSSGSAVTLEIQLAKTWFQLEVIRRASSAPVHVASPEDLIVMKLIANRDCGGSRPDRAQPGGLPCRVAHAPFTPETRPTSQPALPSALARSGVAVRPRSSPLRAGARGGGGARRVRARARR